MFLLLLFGVLFSNIIADVSFIDYNAGDTYLIRETFEIKAHGSAQVNLNRGLRETLGLRDDAVKTCIENYFNGTMPPIQFFLFTESESTNQLNGRNLYEQYNRSQCYANIFADSEGLSVSSAGYYPHILYGFQCNNTQNDATSLKCKHEEPILEKFTAKPSHELETGVETKLDIFFSYTDRLINVNALNETHNYTYLFGKGGIKSNISRVVAAEVEAPPRTQLEVRVSQFASQLIFNVPYKYTFGGNILIMFEQPYKGDNYYFLSCEMLQQCAKPTDFRANVKINTMLSPDVPKNFTGHVTN